MRAFLNPTLGLIAGKLDRSAGWQPAVSPTGSRPAAGCSNGCGLPIRDTADCQSALRWLAFRFGDSVHVGFKDGFNRQTFSGGAR